MGDVLGEKRDPPTIPIVEVFGPVLQGEGPLLGQPTIFVRSGGCSFRCSWCDTLYAVQPDFAHEWVDMSASEIVQAIEFLSEEPIWVTISGGDPALHDWNTVIEVLKKRYSVSLETQGFIPRPWFANLDCLVISPKPPSSGMPFSRSRLQKAIQFGPPERTFVKVVIFDEDDLDFLEQILDLVPVPVYAQVGNPRVDAEADLSLLRQTLVERLCWLTDRVLSRRLYSVRVLPQLHVLMFGTERGR
jgi:7-carboxy-7-deazaguanine synthase